MKTQPERHVQRKFLFIFYYYEVRMKSIKLWR